MEMDIWMDVQYRMKYCLTMFWLSQAVWVKYGVFGAFVIEPVMNLNIEISHSSTLKWYKSL